MHNTIHRAVAIFICCTRMYNESALACVVYCLACVVSWCLQFSDINSHIKYVLFKSSFVGCFMFEPKSIAQITKTNKNEKKITKAAIQYKIEL